MNINSGRINKLQCSKSTLRNGNGEKGFFECELVEENPKISNVSQKTTEVTEIEEIQVSDNVEAELKANLREGDIFLESDEKLFAEVHPHKIEVKEN